MAVNITSIFVKDQWKAGTGDIVSAGVESENGGQAVVWGEMRRDPANQGG